jgi:hypothetical protein
MKAFWSRIARELSPYVPGEQPRIANLVKLNTNESPFGPSPLALEAMRAAAVDTLGFIPILRRKSCARRSPSITGSSPNRSSLAMARIQRPKVRRLFAGGGSLERTRL